MVIFKTRSMIFKVDNKRLSEDIVRMIEFQLRELRNLSKETIKKYNIYVECT